MIENNILFKVIFACYTYINTQVVRYSYARIVKHHGNPIENIFFLQNN